MAKVDMDQVLHEIRVGLGLEIADNEDELEKIEQAGGIALPLFEKVNAVYRQAAGDCYFCSDEDPNEVSYKGDRDHLCANCALKMRRVREYWAQMGMLAEGEAGSC